MLPVGPAPIKNTDSSLELPDQTYQRYTFAEIQSLTHNFDETLVIGRGGFGKVYKCSCKIGSLSQVAVKRLDSMSNQGANEFEAEVNILSKLRHGNLVSLIGYCNEEKEKVIVYDFMPNGTLEHHLQEADSSLSWLERLKICIGAARGLDYLHTGTSTQHGVIHRDVKTSNILLDANFAAKISDFGLAKVCPIDQTRTYVSTGVKGTFGYIDPCYFLSGKLTRKSDVYSFGVVMVEVLSGRKAVDLILDEEQWSLAVWVQEQIKEGKLNQIIDSRLMGQISKKCLKEFANIASHCLSTQRKQRPTMAEVVVKLQSILSHETESANSVVAEGRFIYKVRSFFTGQKSTNQSFKTFKYAELVSATNGFVDEKYFPLSNVYMYKGWIDERTYLPSKYGVGLAIYVRKTEILPWKLRFPATEKLADQPDIKLEEFNHPNLVKLLGYCVTEQELFEVYKLLPHTTLDKYLYGGTTSLSWVARLKIALGAAQGLVYLQQRNKPAYSHFRTNLILVDEDFNARLSDFAFGSYEFRFDASYAAPEWFGYQADTFDSLLPVLPEDVKSEIYTFGVVLLEILTGMKAYDERRPVGKQKLVEWATPLLADEVKFRTIIDPRLQHSDYLLKGAFKLAQLVSNCLQTEQDKRPSMEEILQVLNECFEEEIEPV